MSSLAITIREEDTLEDIKYGINLKENIFISDEHYDIILFDLKLKKKILIIKFHNHLITSLHICKKTFFIDNKESSQISNSFFILSSSLDKKFALHEIQYENNSFKSKLVAQCQPTSDEINGAIQIENGQFLIATRDQTLLLYSNIIINGTFQKLFEIKKEWPMQALSIFEIKNNFIGVSWEYDDAQADETIGEDEDEDDRFKNDGLIIYLVNNNEIKEKKIMEKKLVSGKFFFVLLENIFILQYSINFEDEIGLFDLNNFEQQCKLKIENAYIYPFNKDYFVLFRNDKDIKFELYKCKSLENVQSIQIEAPPLQYSQFNLFQINSNEYAFNKFVIKIENNKK
jgi:hypothetical protein